MADLTITSAVEQIQIIQDLDTGESDLCMYGTPLFKISSSQMSALRKHYYELTSGTTLVYGMTAPVNSKLSVEFIEESNEAWLRCGPLLTQTRIFTLHESQWHLMKRTRANYLGI